MKNFFIGILRRQNGNNHHPSRKDGSAFTAGFFKFLLAFSVIIALSFSVLFFLGITAA